MLKILKKFSRNGIFSNIIFRFLFTYPLVIIAIISLIVYMLTSNIDEAKYQLRVFNFKIQKTIDDSFDKIKKQVEFYGQIINSNADIFSLENIKDYSIHDYFKALYVLDKDKNIIYEKKFSNSSHINFNTPWIDRLKNKRYVISNFVFNDDKVLDTFFVAYNISFDFILVAEVDVNYIKSNINKIIQKEEKSAFVLDYNGNYIGGVYGEHGYKKDDYQDPQNIDKLFVDDKDVIFHYFDMSSELSEYMSDYNLFVVSQELNNKSILIHLVVIFFAFVTLILYTVSTLINLKFVKNKIIFPVKAISDFLKDKELEQECDSPLEDFKSIKLGIKGLYEKIDSLNGMLDDYKTRFGYIFEKSPLILLLYDAYSGKIIDASNAALKFYCYSYDEITSITMTEISNVNFENDLFFRKNLIEDSENKIALRTTHKTKNGKVLDVECKSSVINLKDSRYVFLTVEDVGYYKRVEQNSDIVYKSVSFFKNIIMISSKDDPFFIKYATNNIKNILDIDYNNILLKGLDIRDIIFESERVSFANEINLNKRLFLNIHAAKDKISSIYKVIKNKDEIIPFKIETKFLKDTDGKFKGAVYSISDCLEQQTVKEKYENEINQYKNIILASDVATWDYNSKLKTIRINSKFASLLGFDNQDSMSFNEDKMRHLIVDEFESFDKFFSSIKSENNTFKTDIKLYTINKDIIWLSLSGRALEVDKNENPIFISGVVENITDKKLAFIYQDLVAKLFSYSKDGILILDLEWNITDANDTFLLLSGYLKEETLGSNISLLKSKFNDSETYDKIISDVEKNGQWYGKMWFKYKNSEDCLHFVNITSIDDADNNFSCYAVIISSVGEIKNNQDYLEHIAYHDPLTKLPNRFLFSQKLEELIRTTKNNKEVAIAYLDLDGFKEINDTYGHKAGDKFLIEISSRIDSIFYEKDMFARIGGDEFVAIILYEKFGEVYEFVENILRITREEVCHEGVKLKISASIGVSMRSIENRVTPENLLDQADWAMYQAKLSGKNRYYVFDITKDRHFKNQYEDNNKILTALSNDEFFMEYQPEIDIRTNKILSYEALIRWKRNGEMAYPNDFFPLIKKQKVIDDLSFFSLSSSLKAQSEWSAKGVDAGVCVNLSIEQICKPLFFEKFKNLISQDKKLNPGALQIEIIDANSTPSLEYASKFLHKYKRFGVKFVLDDFASKSSSFDALELLPIDKIKIDKNICTYMFFNKKAFITVRMLKNLSDIFDKHATIKNLQDISTLKVLIGLGFYTFQGNFFQKPISIEEIVDYKFKGIEGLDFNNHIDDNKFNELKDCIMLKEYAQSIINHLVNKDFNSDEDSFEGIRQEILTKLNIQDNSYKNISSIIVESLNTSDKEESLHLARLANIECMKILDIGQK
ncbi:hypothetical protein BB381_05220 [Campylobacter pinnipediorum subsp. caledonicus]|uniref:EAL domain-containing protein n=1 Tax=Campylobacter pinnipediorum TaxID=1965231 RepID=UPI000994A7EE|nr:EAL domain-containing protein [Campylobacter pinnipediorum]OPA72599.1 hypothetical protein BB381_05220 [Campylobacter pinnipediorum subsp. caledonicus]